MPELPELLYTKRVFEESILGSKIIETELKQTIIIRSITGEPFPDFCRGTQIVEAFLNGPFLRLRLGLEKEIIIHMMLAGGFFLQSWGFAKRGVCFIWKLDNGDSLFYLDDKCMSKVYLTTTGNYDQIPKYNTQGLNVLSDDFSLEFFKKAITKCRKQALVFLKDQSVMSAIGSAYGDEILFLPQALTRRRVAINCNQLK